MAKKIMIALNSSWNLMNFRSSLMRGLLNEGYELLAVSPEDEYVPAIKEMGCQYFPLRLASKGKNIFHELRLCHDIYKLLKQTQVDVVLSYTIKPNLYFSFVCHFLNIPIVNTVTGLGTVYFKNNWLTKLVNLSYKIAFKKSRKVFFQNEDDLKFFLAKKMVPASVVGVVPGSGIDLNQFLPATSARQACHIFQFLFVGRVLVDKGVIELIQATRLLKEKGYVFQTAILGFLDPENKRAIDVSQMSQWVDSGDVCYLGSTDDVRPFVSRADCIVLPSYREGISRALLEAAAMGRPIISTNAPGCRDVVDDGISGYICQIKDPIDLALKMEKMLLQEYAVIDEMGLMGRKKVEEVFSEDVVINEYLKVIREIMV